MGAMMECNEQAGSYGVTLRFAQGLAQGAQRCFASLSMTTVWITDIMPLFTLIVSTASKPLRGRLNHYVTMMGNQVMMTVIHTQHLTDLGWYISSSRGYEVDVER